MIELFNRYIYIFLHPFQIHQEFRESRRKRGHAQANVLPFSGPTEVTQLEIDRLPELDEQSLLEEIEEKENALPEFSRAEGIAISWIFALSWACTRCLPLI